MLCRSGFVAPVLFYDLLVFWCKNSGVSCFINQEDQDPSFHFSFLISKWKMLWFILNFLRHLFISKSLFPCQLLFFFAVYLVMATHPLIPTCSPELVTKTCSHLPRLAWRRFEARREKKKARERRAGVRARVFFCKFWFLSAQRDQPRPLDHIKFDSKP